MGILTITEEQVKTATTNGIKRYNVQRRVIDMGWTVEDAITRPVLRKRRLRYTEQDEIEATLNGIPLSTFRSRVNNFGWPVERSKTEPLQYISNTRKDTVMEWDKRIKRMKQELIETEQWINNNDIPQSLRKAITDSMAKQKREILRLELFVKDGQQ
jgi:ATP-dependent Lon protease